MSNRPRRFALALAAGAAVGLLAGGCPSRSPGESLWRKHCADCHGLDGAGNTPRYMGNQYANLLDGSWKTGSDQYSIETVIREGVFGEMPGNTQLAPEDVAQIVDYLYYLRGETR
jgi:mono/diheme cytochrome c family protein